MNYFLVFILLISSLSGFAQQTPKELLSIYKRDYLPTISNRHELFLLEYNKARLLDYITLYKHNTEKINANSIHFQTLMNDWRQLVKSGLNHSADLPLLASIKQEVTNIRRDIQEATLVISSIADAYQKSCSPETISWMNDRFLPTKVYQVPHYQFTGDGANHDLNITFQMNYNTSFGGSSSGYSSNNDTGTAQMGDGSKEATALAAVGMVAGIVAGSLLGPAGSAVGAQLGAAIGLAIGSTVGTIISSVKKMKEANKTYKELKNTFHEINETLEASHKELDKSHEESVQSICRKIFDINVKDVFPEAKIRANSVLSMITSESLSLDKEWEEIRNFHKERLQNHQMFLELVMEGYETNFEKKLENLEEDLLTQNRNLKEYYSTKVAPVLGLYDENDLYQNDELINLHIEGEAAFNHPDYQNYAWKAISDRIFNKVRVK